MKLNLSLFSHPEPCLTQFSPSTSHIACVSVVRSFAVTVYHILIPPVVSIPRMIARWLSSRLDRDVKVKGSGIPIPQLQLHGGEDRAGKASLLL